ITINGSDTAGYDKAKVECFNCHKMWHFIREYRVPRNQENRTRNQETIRRIMNVEDISSKAMMEIDEAGFNWSYMADDEAPTNMAFVAFSNSKINKEKKDIETKIVKFENTSQSLDKLIGSQITDKSKRSLGYVSYNAVSPPYTGRFAPPRINVSHIGLPEFAKSNVESYGVKPIEVVTQTSSVKISEPVKENNNESLIEDWELEREDEARCKYHQRERMVCETNHSRVNHSANTVPKAVFTRTDLKPVDTLRLVNPNLTRRLRFAGEGITNMVEFDIRQEDDKFWRTASAKTIDNEEIKLNAILDGQDKTITEASVRRHLKLADADGISTLPTTKIFKQLALMGHVTDSDKLTFQKGHFSLQ
nr:hypothetical protein [Tanacetum cinerariifolium]